MLLTAGGADASLTTGYGETPADVARRMQHGRLAARLSDRERPPAGDVDTGTLDEFLSRLDLGGLHERFVAENVAVDVLPALTDADLRELGVDRMGDRKRFLLAARRLK